MNTNYSLIFYLKKMKNYVNDPKPIYMRITVAGVRKELSTGRECDPIRWNSRTNRAKGTREDVRNLNVYLDALERKVEDVHVQLVKQEIDISAEVLMSKYQGKDVVRRFLMEVFEEHNAKMEALLGKGFQPNTLKGYKTSATHLAEYLLKDYRTKDIDIRKIDHGFITGYEFFLRSVKECSDVELQL